MWIDHAGGGLSPDQAIRTDVIANRSSGGRPGRRPPEPGRIPETSSTVEDRSVIQGQ